MIRKGLHRLLCYMLFIIMPCITYANSPTISPLTYDTICQVSTQQNTIPYSYQGVDFLLPFQATSPNQYIIEHHDIYSCQIQQHSLTIFPVSQPTTQYETICFGNAYTWNGTQYTTSGSYTDTLTNISGCDSVVILNLTVLPDVVYLPSDSAVICYGETYVWRENEYKTAGIYTDTVRNKLHCDSLIYQLNLTVNTPTTFDTTVVACDHFEWLGENLTASGVYVDTLTNKSGCDSIVTLNLTINNTTTYDTTVVACDSYDWLGKSLTVSGLYVDTLTNKTGCDSIVTLNLTVNYTTTYDTTVVACDSYDWLGKSLTTSGIYVDTLTNKNGCDSIVTLDLTINYSDTAYFTHTACDAYIWHGITFTTSGVYQFDTLTTLGCDSTLFLDLTINYSDTAYFNAVACDSYIWHGVEYTTSGTYQFDTLTIHGCDSLEVLHLTINYTTTFDTTVVACDQFSWMGNDLTTSGIYVDTLINNAGCDSILFLDLVVNYSDTAYFADTACDAYIWHGEIFTNSGTYEYLTETINGCDSLEVLHLKVNHTYNTTQIDTMAGYNPYYWQGDTLLQAGEYIKTLQAMTNCDSIVTLHLIENPVAIDIMDIPEICAGDSMFNIPIYTKGYIDYLQLNYSGDAIKAGFHDTIFSPNIQELQVLSKDVRAGVYDANLVAVFHQQEILSQSLNFRILYPTTIFEQQWNDLISILTAKYNGGYDFMAFQWYKDGELLHNETNSYLHQSLSFGSEYSVLLTASNGLQLMSCPIVPVDLASISIYPTIVNAGNHVKCLITEDATIMLYNSLGRVVGEYHVPAGELNIDMPLTSGMYMFKIITTNNNQREIKVLVR